MNAGQPTVQLWCNAVTIGRIIGPPCVSRRRASRRVAMTAFTKFLAGGVAAAALAGAAPAAAQYYPGYPGQQSYQAYPGGGYGGFWGRGAVKPTTPRWDKRAG